MMRASGCQLHQRSMASSSRGAMRSGIGGRLEYRVIRQVSWFAAGANQRGEFREIDVAARYDGDDFAVAHPAAQRGGDCGSCGALGDDVGAFADELPLLC